MHKAHHDYAELRQRMHEALRVQNPQWVEPDGESPICDDYERRFAKLLEALVDEEETAAHSSLTRR